MHNVYVINRAMYDIPTIMVDKLAFCLYEDANVCPSCNWCEDGTIKLQNNSNLLVTSSNVIFNNCLVRKRH